jgi:hypothetical protein
MAHPEDLLRGPLAPVRFSEETKRLHGLLGQANRAFLEYVERHPECLQRSSFAALDASPELLLFRVQSWPVFLDPEAVGEITRVAVGINRLLKSVPERFFGNDPEILAESYGHPKKDMQLIATLLKRPDHLGSLLARGDFIADAAGFQCLEVNLSSNVGGWQTSIWDRLYRATPPVAGFLGESGLRVSTTETMAALFEHLVEQAAAAGLGEGSELNLLFAIPAHKLGDLRFRDLVDQIYGRLLEELRGWRGKVLVSGYEDLEARGDKLYFEGHRIHVAVEHYGSIVPREVLFPFLAGNLLLVNGPVSRILDDRRNLALLSQYQDSDFFTAEERALLRAHVPWTRNVSRDYADYQGERVFLPDLLLARRERMVLKHVVSSCGEKVLFGAAMPRQVWEAAVADALTEGLWIVQELVEFLPYWCQTGPSGCAPHDLVWGLFVFGDRYGGGFLRMRPSGTLGAINSAQGAEEAILFEVDTAERSATAGEARQ